MHEPFLVDLDGYAGAGRYVCLPPWLLALLIVALVGAEAVRWLQRGDPRGEGKKRR